MKESILKAVAQPPKLFGAPYLPAFINLLLHMFLILLQAFRLKGDTIMYIILGLGITHGLIVLFGKREPHMSNIILSYFKTPSGSNNILKEKGDKFIP